MVAHARHLVAALAIAAAAAAPAAQPAIDPAFAEAFADLRRGQAYDAGVPRGLVRLSHRVDGTEFPYTIDVPQTYDPSRRYQVRIQLHGGVSRPDPVARGNAAALAGAEQIYVMPVAWDAAPWWHPAQVDSLRVILDRLKRTYNVDENRVVVSGVSDGGTGAFYLAMRDTTPYASFLPLNGFIMILANPSSQIREQLFPNNLRNKPFFVVNGGRDPLYPTALVDPYVQHLQKGGVDLAYRPQPDGVHNTAWWPDVKDAFERFAAEHPREPHPANLTWEADEVPSRAHWLVIEALGPRGAEEPLADLNERTVGTSPNFGVRADGMRVTMVMKGSNAESFGLQAGDLVERINGRAIPAAVPLLDILEVYDAGTRLTFTIVRGGETIERAGTFQPALAANTVPLFPRRRPSGRVDLERRGNTIRATTRGVAAFTLLLSPDVFDFARPITVVADGRTVFDARVPLDVATLRTWAARDHDRTMLYGAEIRVEP
jgi:poly(3-hydroxybutyrate) depolymerase